MQEELKCPCCGLDGLDGGMLSIIEAISMCFPDVVWTSGCRCELHNRAVGGTIDSGHLAKWGMDGKSCAAGDWTLKVWDDYRARKVIQLALREGATGVGIYYDNKKPHGHIDRKPRFQIWRKTRKLKRTEYWLR